MRLEWALYWARRGFKVFPCHPRTKDPATVDGFHSATTDELEIYRWWAANPEYNIAYWVAGSGLFMVDTDVRAEADGEKLWMELGGVGYDETLTIRTPSGGYHRLFKAPEGVDFVQDSSGRDFGFNIDTRFQGYGLLPGSYVVEAAKGYEGAYELAHDAEPLLMSGMVLERAKRRTPHAPAVVNAKPRTKVSEGERQGVLERLDELAQEITDAPAGTGNATTLSVATRAGGYVAAGQITMDDALGALGPAADARDHLDTLRRQLEWGAKAEPRPWTVVQPALQERISKRPEKAAEPTTQTIGGSALMPKPSNPMEVCRRILADHFTQGGVQTLRHAEGQYWEFARTHWTPRKKDYVVGRFYQILERAHYATQRGDVPWEPNSNSVGRLEEAMRVGILGMEDHVIDNEGVFTESGAFDFKSEQWVAPSIGRFNTACLPFNHDVKAECPRWLSFLESSLAEDQTVLLQEWFGYVVSGQTRRHKLMLLTGVTRGGKSTVANVLKALVGDDFTTRLRMADFGNPFGTARLENKSLCIVEEAKWDLRFEGAKAVSMLKDLSSGGELIVERKGVDSYITRQRARFCIVSNDMPRFSDASGAMSNRMLHCEFRVSHLGREDLGLEDALLGELPGILNWALEGLARLEKQGQFTLPESTSELREDIERQQSATASFIKDWLVVTGDNEDKIAADAVYAAAKQYAEENHHGYEPTYSGLLNDLKNVVGVSKGKARIPGRPNTGAVFRGVKFADGLVLQMPAQTHF